MSIGDRAKAGLLPKSHDVGHGSFEARAVELGTVDGLKIAPRQYGVEFTIERDGVSTNFVLSDYHVDEMIDHFKRWTDGTEMGTFNMAAIGRQFNRAA